MLLDRVLDIGDLLVHLIFADATPVTVTPYFFSVSVMPWIWSCDQSRLTVCMEMPTLKFFSLILAASASDSASTSGEAAFSPWGPWPTIDLGPSFARSTPLTQVAGTSARADGIIERAAAATNAVKGKDCRKIGFIVSSIFWSPIHRRASDLAPTRAAQ
ncbi:hypothetical protein [Bradyrhizobium barranii]